MSRGKKVRVVAHERAGHVHSSLSRDNLLCTESLTCITQYFINYILSCSEFRVTVWFMGVGWRLKKLHWDLGNPLGNRFMLIAKPLAGDMQVNEAACAGCYEICPHFNCDEAGFLRRSIWWQVLIKVHLSLDVMQCPGVRVRVCVSVCVCVCEI